MKQNSIHKTVVLDEKLQSAKNQIKRIIRLEIMNIQKCNSGLYDSLVLPMLKTCKFSEHQRVHQSESTPFRCVL